MLFKWLIWINYFFSVFAFTSIYINNIFIIIHTLYIINVFYYYYYYYGFTFFLFAEIVTVIQFSYFLTWLRYFAFPLARTVHLQPLVHDCHCLYDIIHFNNRPFRFSWHGLRIYKIETGAELNPAASAREQTTVTGDWDTCLLNMELSDLYLFGLLKALVSQKWAAMMYLAGSNVPENVFLLF